MSSDLDKFYSTALEVTKKAGEMVLAAYDQEKRIETKMCAADLVTETDQNVEKEIISTLSSAFPTHSFIGEESVAAGKKCLLTDNPTWIIDPIDGTTNFVHRFPFSCISVALAVNKEIVIGLVYNPVSGHMYTARTGLGAFLNGKPIKSTDTKKLEESLICCEFGSSRNATELDSKFSVMRKVLEQAHGLRSVGSCALAMCLVASGNGDAYYEYGIHCWDMAAGILMVQEAGGVVIDPLGKEVDIMCRGVLCAGTQELANQLSTCMKRIDLERD